MDKVTEIAEEQAAFDAAWEQRERMRAQGASAPSAAASPKDAVTVNSYLGSSAPQLRGPDEAVAFGRIDSDDGDVWRIGYHAIWDEGMDLLVINWKMGPARAFYEATVDDPMGLVRRRQYSCQRNTIIDFDDLVFAELAESIQSLDAAPQFDDVLLADLQRGRSGEMRDIVQTIQAAQYQVIQAPLDQILVVQGGPGTGKTAVALHRVSWLLYNHRDTLSPDQVLVVGPNPTFTRYIRGVLPALGDSNVVELDINSIGSLKVAHDRVEDPAVARLKGSLVMKNLLRRALEQRVSYPEETIEVAVGGRIARVETSAVQSTITSLRNLSYAAGRQSFRSWLISEVSRQTRSDDAAIRQAGVEAVVERVWPQMTPQSLVRDLYNSRERLALAAGDELSAGEAASLFRRQTDRLSDESWSAADVAVLDAAEALISGDPSRQFAHIVVDEAQDLSPMQWNMLSRRSSAGSMTIVGDIAQSTGPWARDTWTDITAQLTAHIGENLGEAVASNVEELRFGYRVPAPVYDLARRILPYAAPEVTPPQVVRDGPQPSLLEVSESDVPVAAVRDAMQHAAHGRSVGLICPVRFYDQVRAELDRNDIGWTDVSKGLLGSSINLIRPADAKGLELDAIVVVQPESIVEEVERGLRMLYVALTRTTKYLTVVHTGVVLPLPDHQRGHDTGESAPPTSEPTIAPPRDEPTTTPTGSARAGPRKPSLASQLVELAATELAQSIRDATPAHLWGEVLERVRELLQAQNRGDGE